MDITTWLRGLSNQRERAWGKDGLLGCRYNEAADDIERLRAALKVAFIWMPTYSSDQHEDLKKARKLVTWALGIPNDTTTAVEQNEGGG